MTRSTLWLIASLAASCALLIPVARANATPSPFPIFPTGVDGSGNQLPGGAPDSHYTAQNNGGPINPAVALSRSNYFGSWPNPSSGGEWINFIDSTQTFGTTDFYTTFNLTGYDPSSAKISLLWTSDNGSTVFLNGTPVLSRGGNDFTQLFNDTITTGFQPGINTLDFRVSMDSIDGLIVNSISGTANPVPEPASLILLAIGALAVVQPVLRRFKTA